MGFFAFLAVFLVHSDVTRFWWGSHGVSLFFVISGFLIARILIAFENRPRKQVLGEAAKLGAILLREIGRLAREVGNVNWQTRGSILSCEISDRLTV